MKTRDKYSYFIKKADHIIVNSIEFKKEDPDKAQYYPLTVDTVIIHTLQPLVKYPKVCYDRYTRIARFNGKKQGTLR